MGLARHKDGFRVAGVRIVAISADDMNLARAAQVAVGDAMTMRVDPHARGIDRLGLADRDEAVPHVIARPAIFIIDEGGVVRYRYVSRTADDRPKPELLLLAAESLRDEAD